jgi:hypothetical protein
MTVPPTELTRPTKDAKISSNENRLCVVGSIETSTQIRTKIAAGTAELIMEIDPFPLAPANAMKSDEPRIITRTYLKNDESLSQRDHLVTRSPVF